jgi:ribosomal protein L15
MYARAGG